MINKILKQLAGAYLALALISGTAFALDAAEVLKRASDAMGAGDLNTIRILTTGSEFVLGQNATPGGAWPEYKLDQMISSYNYQTGSSSEELVGPRTRVDNPPRGGGEPSLPRGTTFVTDGYVWSQIGPRSISRPWNVADRTHQIWITPHGFIKAAMKNNASVKKQTKGGKPVYMVSFTEPGKYCATGTINADNFVERIESRATIPFYGEMLFITTYSDYKSFGAINFPTHIQRSQGGFPLLDLTVKDVQANVAVDIKVPDSLKQSPPQPNAVKIADGIWEVPGSANCYAIEMSDHIIVIEAPLTNAIATAVFDAVKRAIPNKPIKFVINTHHHIDHSGGLRAAVAEGATVVTSIMNKRIFPQYLAAPLTFAPDEMSTSKKKATLKYVDDKLVMRDATRVVEIYNMHGNRHADDLLMIYLPKDKLLIEADALSPGPPNTPPPSPPDVFTVNLVDNIERLKLPIDRLLPLHGAIAPLSELYRMVGKNS
jgi:glyoxylase-like metal-dependent hydrolase (beta-lactamase superfamily II)